jgi:DNA-binding NtrC family response regulator
MSRILIIEDEASIRRVLVKILTEENNQYQVFEAEDGLIGTEMIKKDDLDLVLCDIKMPNKDGLEVLQAAKDQGILTPFIMLTGHGNIQTAVESMKIGAYDFIPKPPDLNRLLISVRNALESKNLVVENVQLKKRIAKAYQMIGKSNVFEGIKEMIDKVAPTKARVLITGPNGTGKELVAHQIHQKSERNKQPLIEVNCAAIPSELIESELFGHVKGSFTSAVKDRKGKFETAHNGTLFLDEIGDMSLSAQAKVLRALESNSIQKVGAQKDIKINVRVIAATNKNLKEEITKGNFREDLYHRLGVILINNPSLDERKEDIPVLTEHFNKQICEEHGIAEKTFSPDALKTLQSYSWSGNIREFRNVIERLIILCSDTVSKKDVKSFAGKE